jgi:hypothetical protein
MRSAIIALLAPVLAPVLVPVLVSGAVADAAEECRVVDFDFTPTDDLQIVIWIEDAAGNYIDTAYITSLTGTYGLGNRPGRMDFNTAWRWPYGRRTNTFPVWAHRHDLAFPLVVFQNSAEDNLSHPFSQSSTEQFYCRPLDEANDNDLEMWDAESCASTVFTDKGELSSTLTSAYPPREDLKTVSGIDDPSVQLFDQLNPFDAVSRATPPGGAELRVSWSIGGPLAGGEYVAWIEVAKELDQNASHDYPEPADISWDWYGIPGGGQPSVVWRIPFSLEETTSTASVIDYLGYGDPFGEDGEVREPDGSITTDVPGSGASRLLLTKDDGEMYRFRVSARASTDDGPPGAPSEAEPVDITATAATVSFIAPGDDADLGPVAGFEVRWTAGTPMNDVTFPDANLAAVTVLPAEAGSLVDFTLDALLPSTHYYIGIQAYDECFNRSPVTVVEITTAEREVGTVDACFVATAAYGSLMANDVEVLRGFRDVYLRSNVFGELAVEAYYTFGPLLADFIDLSDTARETARTALEPMVAAVRRLMDDEPVARR